MASLTVAGSTTGAGLFLQGAGGNFNSCHIHPDDGYGTLFLGSSTTNQNVVSISDSVGGAPGPLSVTVNSYLAIATPGSTGNALNITTSPTVTSLIQSTTSGAGIVNIGSSSLNNNTESVFQVIDSGGNGAVQIFGRGFAAPIFMAGGDVGGLGQINMGTSFGTEKLKLGANGDSYDNIELTPNLTTFNTIISGPPGAPDYGRITVQGYGGNANLLLAPAAGPANGCEINPSTSFGYLKLGSSTSNGNAITINDGAAIPPGLTMYGYTTPTVTMNAATTVPAPLGLSGIVRSTALAAGTYGGTFSDLTAFTGDPGMYMIMVTVNSGANIDEPSLGSCVTAFFLWDGTYITNGGAAGTEQVTLGPKPSASSGIPPNSFRLRSLINNLYISAEYIGPLFKF